MKIIPTPRNIEVRDEQLDLREIGRWEVDSRFAVAERVMRGYFPSSVGDKTLRIRHASGIEREGYRLDIRLDGIDIDCSSLSGALYALTSLRILGGVDIGKSNAQSLLIKDAPRYGYRGINIDVARYFVSVEGMKHIIDLMLLHKLNVLHWHLTDDQGWRIEIKKYPRLTEIGSHREKSNIHGWCSADDDGTPHAGFYTQEDIREVVAYAQDRGVMIIPEIDMPAHFTAAFAAYPWLGCREIEGIEPAWYMGGHYAKSIGWKDWNRSACIGKKSTFEFIFNVIDEIFELFPAPYFHIGGDEAPKDEWKVCPLCQARMRENGLQTVDDLQCYFINRVYEYVRSKGRRLIGWNEVLQGGGLDRDVIVQYWTPQRDGKVLKHLRQGGNVILSKHQSFYFDMCYAQYPLSNTYEFNPRKLGVKSKYMPQVLGYEGHQWAEWTPDMHKREMQLFPRVTALAEISWSDYAVDQEEFLGRLSKFEGILDSLGVNYAEKEIRQNPSKRDRAKVTYAWYNSDQDIELRRNEEIKKSKRENKDK